MSETARNDPSCDLDFGALRALGAVCTCSRRRTATVLLLAVGCALLVVVEASFLKQSKATTLIHQKLHTVLPAQNADRDTYENTPANTDQGTSRQNSSACHECEYLLRKESSWKVNRTDRKDEIAHSGLHFSPWLVERARECGYMTSGSRITPDEATDTLKRAGRILFVGNSVVRRFMHAMALLAVGEEHAPVNPIASDKYLIKKYGYQRIFDQKMDDGSHDGLMELVLKDYNTTMRFEEWTHLADHGDEFWRRRRRENERQDAVMGLVFTATPPQRRTRELLNACNNLPEEGTIFPRHVCDNYDIMVIQLTYNPKITAELLEVTREYIRRRPSMRIIFVGVPHMIGDKRWKVRNWLREDVWPRVRAMGADVLDVTLVTYDAIKRGVVSHELSGNLQHFMDQGRLLMASLVLNRLRAGSCQGLQEVFGDERQHLETI